MRLLGQIFYKVFVKKYITKPVNIHNISICRILNKSFRAHNTATNFQLFPSFMWKCLLSSLIHVCLFRSDTEYAGWRGVHICQVHGEGATGQQAWGERQQEVLPGWDQQEARPCCIGGAACSLRHVESPTLETSIGETGQQAQNERGSWKFLRGEKFVPCCSDGAHILAE